ncbi:MAG: hypothetical protein ACRCW5_06510 [Cetobacterium sp.]|uniref:hypothetical protein n=1 Tax=Cetobacterium sp. TaxID=2071632 RepID=UPI003F3C3F36
MKNNSFMQNKRKRTLFFANIMMITFIIFQFSVMGFDNPDSKTFLIFLLGDLLLLGFQVREIIKGNKSKI